METQTILNVAIIALLVIVIVSVFLIRKKLKQQELMHLVNNISDEISKPNFKRVEYVIGKYGKDGNNRSQQMIVIDDKVFKDMNDYNFKYKGFKVKIATRGSTIYITGTLDAFECQKNIAINI